MGTFPGTPRTLRGAIVAVDPRSPLSRIVVFQYNPDTVIRALTPHDTRGNTHRISAAPTEQITKAKHALVQRVRDWPYSSFHRYVTDGILPDHWAGDAGHGGGEFGERW